MGEAMMGVFLVVAALIVASVPIYKLMGWWVEGAVEPILAGVGMALYIALIGGVMGAPSAINVVLIVVLVISAALTPIFGQVSDRVQMGRIDDHRLHSYSRALEDDPMNHPARMGLAEALYKKGDLDSAIEHLSWTLEQAPKLSMRIRPQLDSWKREKERIGAPQWIVCHQCYAENMPATERCEKCGAAFGTRAGVQQRVWREGGPKVVIRAWITTSLAIIIACGLFRYLPTIIAGPLIVATLLVGVFLFLKWAGGDMGTVGD